MIDFIYPGLMAFTMTIYGLNAVSYLNPLTNK
jgi:hypothetical protein